MNQTDTKKIKTAAWSLVPILTGIILAAFLFKITSPPAPLLSREGGAELAEVPGEVLQASVAQSSIPLTQTQYFYTNKNQTSGPKVSAKAYVIGDLNTGEIIASKNQDQVFPLASVSKLMTALVASNIAPDDVAQVSKSALRTEGTNGELRPGEKLKVTDLLQPLLLESSNDAAEVLAEHFGRDTFLAKMNAVAQQLQMTGTTYADPSGLSINNKSTASDMFKLAGYLMKQAPDLIKITAERSYTIKKKHSWSNISQFLRDDGYIGGKSGYTDPAKQTVVSIFNLPLGKSGVRPVAITLLQSTDRHKDVESIVKYLKKNVYYGGLADAATNWVEEKIGLPEAKDPDFLTLAFGGDIMLDRGVRASVIKNFNDDYSAIFAKSKDLGKIFDASDAVFANLEGTASDQGADQKNLYSFRMDPAVIPALKGAGISILSVANNHIGDWGRPAYMDTLARLKENEILYTGGGNNKAEAETPAIIEKYGMKIGFLAFSDKGPNYMAAGSDTAGELLASDPDFDKIIQNAAKQLDYLIVSFHFGEEYQTKHNARQEELAHKAIDDGAKIIIGSHPHVVEDTEIYKNGYIAYSLGNFVFDQKFAANTMQGMLLEMKLFKDGSLIVKKDTTQLNSVFQIEKVTQGKEEKIKFQ